mgnify:CR=1 FL=1
MTFLELLQIIGFPLIIISLIIPFLLQNKNKLDIELTDEEFIKPFKKDYGLKILIDSHEVKGPIYTISGRLINNGNTDISALDVVEPIEIKFTKEAIIRTEKMPDNNPAIGSYNLKDNILKFNLKLIKPGECINFSLLYASNNASKENVKVFGRLINIKTIRVLTMPLYKKRYLKIMLCISAITIVVYLLNVLKVFSIINSTVDRSLILGIYIVMTMTLIIRTKMREKRIELKNMR